MTTHTAATSTRRPSRRATVALSVATLAGLLHGAASTYWGLGGTAMLDTLSDSVVEMFRGREWLALPIGAAKIVAALVPLVLALRGGLTDRVLRGLAWAGALGIAGWGALTAIPAQLVLLGVIHPEGGTDRLSLMGHAWIWEPLFVLWGLALAAGLWWTRPGRRG